MTNKRKNERLSCAVPVEGQEGGEFDQTQTIDFSKDGLGFISKKPIALNKEIAIELNLDGDEEDSVLVVGRVTWVEPLPNDEGFRIGLHFKDVLDGSKSRLTKYFQKQ